jgi:hypothetical protein
MADLNTVLQILLAVILMSLGISSFIDSSKDDGNKNINNILAFLYLIAGLALMVNKVMGR